jgi:beta-N-acetylhexosaminidase
MIDIAGTTLTDLDRERLCHPLVGGIILFTRNYTDPAQLSALTAEIHALRQPPLLITVDHEGGRVQRFRNGFTRLPAPGVLGQLWEQDQAAALAAAQDIGYVLAAELRAHGVDFSFTPVLDLNYGRSTVIGDRALHSNPQVVAALANAVIAGLREAGMASCGKHFPGHGYVEADSHIAIPIDERPLEAIAVDMEAFRAVRPAAVMPAHVIYPQVDNRPAGFSPVWVGMLRELLGLDGVIFSDDLSMEGASVAGDIVARVDAAWQAGCDVLLVCNAPDSVDAVLTRWTGPLSDARPSRIQSLIPQGEAPDMAALQAQERYQAALATVTGLQGKV